MTCEEFLELWDRGQRTPEAEAHLASCAECRAMLAVDGRVKAWTPPLPATPDADFLASLRKKLAAPAPRLRGPRPAPRGIPPWLRLAAAAVVLGAIGAAYLLGRASVKRGERPAPVAVNPPKPEEPRKPTPPPEVPQGPGPKEKPPVEKPPGKPKSDFRDRLVAAAAGTGRDAFLEQVKGGVDRARWIAAFRSADAEEREAAVTIASLVKDAALTPQLAAAAAKGDEQAITLLGQIGSVESVVALAGLAGVKSRREAVVAALAETGRPEAGEALAAIGAWEAEAAWRKLGDAAGPALAARIRAGGDRALPAVQAAAWARAGRAVPELARLLAKKETRGAAAKALAAIGGREANRALAVVADQDDQEVMAALKESMGHAEVEERMLDVRLQVADRVRACRVLLALGDPFSVPALIQALECPELREPAMIALAGFRAESAVPAISALLRERRHRSVAAVALGTIGSPTALPALLDAAKEKSFYSEATRAIAKLRAPASVPHLIGAIGDREAGSEAIAALAVLRDSRAVYPLIVALQGEHATEAWKALQAITGQKLPPRASEWARWWKSQQKGPGNFFFDW